MDWTNDRPLTHPGAKGITAELIAGLQKNFFIRRSRRIIFVCGGPTDPKNPSRRAEFLTWAQANVKSEALLLRAETAYGAATERGKKFINLSEFEEILANISDCVLIFPESAGAFSEVGIFATQESIRDKTLIANDSSHETHDSFLLLGPFHTINSSSRFNPSVNADSTKGPDPTHSARIWDRIRERTKSFGKRQRPQTCHFAEMHLANRMAIIAWVLRITSRAKFGDLLDILRATFGAHDGEVRALKQTLAMLLALDQILMPAEDLYRTKPRQEFGLEVDVRTAKLRALFRTFWLKEFPKLWSY